jgi:hypothetical protein
MSLTKKVWKLHPGRGGPALVFGDVPQSIQDERRQRLTLHRLSDGVAMWFIDALA